MARVPCQCGWGERCAQNFLRQLLGQLRRARVRFAILQEGAVVVILAHTHFSVW